MQTLRFDEEELKRRIHGLPPHARCAFAVACAERLRLAYVGFALRRRVRRNAGQFEAILDRVWSDAMGESMSSKDVDGALKEVMRLIPDEDGGTWEDAQAFAEDGATALAYALRCRKTGESQEAAWAGRCGYEAADYWATHAGGVDLSAPDGEERALHHPVVQAELRHQQVDLEELESADPRTMVAVIARVRNRARRSRFKLPREGV